MTRTYTRTGNSRPHVVHSGYRYQSNQSARFEPAPELRKGTIRGFLAMCLAIAGGFAAITGAFALRAEPASGLVATRINPNIAGETK